jgi:hypothetical protein
MAMARFYLEKLLFPGWSHGQRRRHMRFLMLAMLLGTCLCIVFGLVLYLMNSRGH